MNKILFLIVSLLIFEIPYGADMGLFGKKKVSLEDQLSTLSECDLQMSSSATIDDLFIWGPRETIEKEPYNAIIESLASDIEREPYSPVCNKLWMCDYERIEDHGAYKEVIERLELMTEGALGLTNIQDYVDVEEGKAWVQFEFNKKTIKWDAEVDDDWLDPYIIVKYDALLKESGKEIRIYSNHGDYGQVAFLAAFTPSEYACYKKLSPIKLKLIESQI